MKQTLSFSNFRGDLLQKRLLLLITTPCLAGFSLLGCAAPAPEQAADSPATDIASPSPETRHRLGTTTPGVRYLANTLMPEAEILYVLPTGGDPAHGAPDVDAILALREVDLIVAHHRDYETWMATASLPSAKVVWTAQELPLLDTEAKTHSHGPEGEHSHRGVEPRIQLDPGLVADQAEQVADALIDAFPRRRADIEARLDPLLDALDGLDAALAEVLETVPDGSIAATEGLAYWRERFDIPKFQADGSADVVLKLESEPDPPDTAASKASQATVIELDDLTADQDGTYAYAARFRANLDRLRETTDSAGNQ